MNDTPRAERMLLTGREYAVLDDIFARLVDAKIAGVGIPDAQLALVVKLQHRLHEHEIAQVWRDGIDLAFCATCGERWGA